MITARISKINEKCNEFVVCTASDSTTMESIVSAQRGLQTVHEIIQMTNKTILKLWSIFVSKAPKVIDHNANVLLFLEAVNLLHQS